MIIYSGSKADFMNEVVEDTIAYSIRDNIQEKMHRKTGEAEFRSWVNSLEYMYKVLNDDGIPQNSGIAIEYNLPNTAKRVDFLVSGYDKECSANVVVIELKQWEKLNKVEGLDGLVETYTGGANRRVVHPSYQAWSYAQMIKDYNEYAQISDVRLWPCAYLHNYLRTHDDPLDDPIYKDYLDDAPAFAKGDVKKLREYIKNAVMEGDDSEILYEIDNGRIKPSKSLQDAIVGMLESNPEFNLNHGTIATLRKGWQEAYAYRKRRPRNRKNRHSNQPSRATYPRGRFRTVLLQKQRTSNGLCKKAERP